MSEQATYITINSADRNSATSTGSHDFEVKLADYLVGKFEISQCIIMNTFYNINAYNNSLTFNDGADRTVTVTAGAYTGSALASALQTAMNASGTALTFAVSIGSTSNKMTISAGSAFVLKFATFTTNSIAKYIGFNASDTSSATSQVGSNVVDLAYPRMCFVEINNIHNVVSTTGVMGSLVFPIVANSTDASQYISNSVCPMYVEFPTKVSTLQVKLRDDRNQPLNLNGSDWWLTLRRVPRN